MAKQAALLCRKLPAALVCAALSANVQQARAQAAPDAGEVQVPEVVVTAQRTSSLASRTPVAMSAVSGVQLDAAGLATVADLAARLPSVHLNGAPDGLKITIRGVSNADTTEKGDPSAAFMLDGIYIARPQAQNVSFFDLARIEVLRGPQGTLYGRNATAGVVNVISNTPGKTLEGAFGVELGSYASRKANAMLNVPVSDTLALRAALAYNKHDSYLTNGQGTGYHLGLDRDDVSARLSARLALGKTASLLLRYDHSSAHPNNDSFVPVGNFYSVGPDGMPVWKEGSTSERLTNRFVPPNAPLQQGASDATNAGLGAELDWNLGALTLHYLGAHRSFDYAHLANFYYGLPPQAPVPALGVRESFDGQYRQDSHEVRVSTNGGGPLKAQAGVYYLRETADVRYSFRDLELLGVPPYYVFPHHNAVQAKAVFGQATWTLAPRWRATLGARYSSDDKTRVGASQFQQGPEFNPQTDGRMLNLATVNTHKTTWRLGGEFDLAPATLLFATVSTGYKAGGFNDGCLAGSAALGLSCTAPGAVPVAALIYQPETLTAYEAGVKSRFWGNRASVNVTAFSYDYANLQLSGVVMVGGEPQFVTTNAAKAKVTGLELDGQLNVGALDRIQYSLTLLDAHYVRYAPRQVAWDGRDLDRAPGVAATLGYEHTFRLAPGRVTAGLFTRHSGAYTISVPDQLRQYRVPARSESDLTLGYQPDQGNWSVHAHVKNLENKVGPLAIDSFGMTLPSDPRTWGARLDYRF